MTKIFSTRADWRVIFFTAMIFFMRMTPCAADSELDAAEIRLACAICSMGAYSDDEGYLMRSMLTTRGWQIEKLSRKNNLADAKAYLASKGDVKILAIAGTESLKDVEVDFRLGRVQLNGNTALDAKEKHSGDKLFVHRGFRDYADVVLGDGLAERLKASLAQNPRETLYLTGHSLGGSVATIVGIRLADSGVSKAQLKVMTFGAMAVGSKALAAAYDGKLDLTRVVVKGDIVKKSLRALGYVQFGKALEYRQSASDDHLEHKMAVYLDCAIRDYFAAGGTFNHEAKTKNGAAIYAAPIIVVEDCLHKDDAEILLPALNNSLTNHFSNLILAPTRSVELDEDKIADEDFDEYVAAARNLGCKYVLIRILNAQKIRDAKAGEKLVTLEEIILNDKGIPLFMQTSGASTENLTVLEAALAAQETLTLSLFPAP